MDYNTFDVDLLSLKSGGKFVEKMAEAVRIYLLPIDIWKNSSFALKNVSFTFRPIPKYIISNPQFLFNFSSHKKTKSKLIEKE